MEENYIVAFEIGSSKIKGALVVNDPTGMLNVVAVQEEHVSESVRYGQIKNVEDVSGIIDSIRQKLEKSQAILPRKINGAYIGLSGSTVCSCLAEASLHFDIEEAITADTVAQLKAKAIASLDTDREVYDAFPREFIVDNHATTTPIGIFAHDIKVSFVVISGAPGIKNNINRVFPGKLGIDVRGYVLSAIALADAVVSDDEKKLGCMFVDFGAETTTVSIYRKASLNYLVTLPMGSRNITRDLVSLNYLEDRAEAIKRSVGVGSFDNGPRMATADGIDQTEISNYINSRAGEIIANVIAQVEFAGFKVADLPAGMIIVGGGARLKGFSDMLASQSKMKVRTGMLPRNIRISDSSLAANDAVDVVSLVLSAVKAGANNCVAPLPTEQPKVEISQDIPYDNDYDGESRIGREDFDDDLLDDDDDRRRHKVKKEKPKKTPKPASEKRGLGIFGSLRNRIERLMTDNNDNFDDIDGNDSDI
jgi:cell division protein FtsA